MHEELMIVNNNVFLNKHNDKKDPPRIVPRAEMLMFAINVVVLITQKYNFFLNFPKLFFLIFDVN